MRFFCLNLAIKAVLFPKISGGTFWQGLDISDFLAGGARQSITNKLLLVMAIAPGLFGLCALT
jgi:hypothetical protein